MMSLCNLVEKAKVGDKESMELLIIRFEPIINSLSWKLANECGKTDLIIFFIKMIYEVKLKNIINSSDGALVNYIKQSLYREYYRLSKRNSTIEFLLIDTFTVDVSDHKDNEYEDVEDEIFLNELVVKKIINKKQKHVLLSKYYYKYTDEELAKELCVSRQAVSKMHKQTIKNLKAYLN